MRTNRPYVQIDPDVLERVRQIDLLSYLREFEPTVLTVRARIHYRKMRIVRTVRTSALCAVSVCMRTTGKNEMSSDFKSFCVAYMVSSRYGVDTRGFDFSRLPREYAEMDTQAFKGELGTMRDVLGEIQSDMYKSMEKNKPAKSKEQER